MYCLNCYYDLRGLAEHRCPECGRAFSPDRPGSYSATARPERLQKLVKQASNLLGEALTAMEPADPAARSLAALRRQVSRLSVENWDLQRQVAALTRALLDRGVLDPVDLSAAAEVTSLADVAIVDDTEEPTASADDEEVATSELIDLQRAVDDHAAG